MYIILSLQTCKLPIGVNFAYAKVLVLSIDDLYKGMKPTC